MSSLKYPARRFDWRQRVQTAPNGHDTPRLCEQLANGRWRVDWLSGLVSTYADDPKPFFAQGYDPHAYAYRGHLHPESPRVASEPHPTRKDRS